MRFPRTELSELPTVGSRFANRPPIWSSSIFARPASRAADGVRLCGERLATCRDMRASREPCEQPASWRHGRIPTTLADRSLRVHPEQRLHGCRRYAIVCHRSPVTRPGGRSGGSPRSPGRHDVRSWFVVRFVSMSSWSPRSPTLTRDPSRWRPLDRLSRRGCVPRARRRGHWNQIPFVLALRAMIRSSAGSKRRAFATRRSRDATECGDRLISSSPRCGEGRGARAVIPDG